MSVAELTRQLASLPLPERVELAQALWESVHEEVAPRAGEADSVIELARRRDGDLASGSATGRSHDQVMEAARRLLR